MNDCLDHNRRSWNEQSRQGESRWCQPVEGEQLAKDALVAEREGLQIALVQGDMAALSCFPEDTFDLIFHPASNVFVEDVRRVCQECFRVLKSPGRLLAGFMNSDFYLFDHELIEDGGELLVPYRLPYSDIRDLDRDRLEKRRARLEALEFSQGAPWRA